ncbi:MAG: nitroreductase family deazaflavin-dependent oxidoreductase [Anaerolineae bacterium]|nr:nitroreductase family deazaflavin-dependent oxidoreductase [Anaerolineae bacterium]
MNPLWKAFIRLQNPMMKWLLGSPLHFFTSGMFMLISFTGRKSGKTYMTPVQYKQDGNTLYVITSAEYTWWKNLRGGADVKLRLRGKDISAWAETSSDPETIAAVVEKFYPSLSEEARANFVSGKVALMLRLQENGKFASQT